MARALEGAKGFDMFMAAAKLVYQQFENVHFIVVGDDMKAYDAEMNDNMEIKSFKLSKTRLNQPRSSFAQSADGGLPARVVNAVIRQAAPRLDCV